VSYTIYNILLSGFSCMLVGNKEQF
jgi:hypothetical protein